MTRLHLDSATLYFALVVRRDRWVAAARPEFGVLKARISAEADYHTTAPTHFHRPPETRPVRMHRWGLGGWYHRSIM